MQTRLIKLRFRRRLRKGQKQVEGLGTQAEDQINKHLLGRFERLKPVRRFVLSWLALLLLIIFCQVLQNISLGNHYQTLKPVAGGVYSEGVVGQFTNANPIFAVSDADATVSRLIFSGLLAYDVHGKLIGDLASDWDVQDHGSTYVVHLKPNLEWQDGQPLTSQDVLFTYKLIQNPDVQSPLQNDWRGVDVSAPDPRTIVFKLPGVLVSFPSGLTTGIVPKHLLENVAPANLRTADFNTVSPVGAGPFAWETLDVKSDGNPQHNIEKISFTPFLNYASGPPQLHKFVVQIFADPEQALKAFDNNELTGLTGLSGVPEKYENSSRIIIHSLPLNAANMVFFKVSAEPLNDVNIRKALVRATNEKSIVEALDYPTRYVREPLLLGQVGYDKKFVQAKFDPASAKLILDTAGWKVDPTKHAVRYKAGRPLSFTLTVADTPEYHMVAGKLKNQWAKIGVKLDLEFQSSNDFQNALIYHSYEAILYGVSVGPDSDVFVYWHSSQADIRSANRLNLAEYKSSVADLALEAGRTRLDPAIRTIKYKPFLQAWQADVPAIGLYQPRLLYLTNGRLNGLSEAPINNATDRLINVQNWQIREARVTD